jgi:ethanolamine kinase
MGSSDTTNGAPALRYIPLTYTPADSQASALRLILTLFPHWEGPGNKIEFVRFTDGITNTVCPYRNPFPVIQSLTSTLQLLKIINRKAGLTDEEIDNDAVLMRAYGNGTEILIDRESMRFPGLPPKALSPFAPDSGPMRQTPWPSGSPLPKCDSR